MSFKLFKKKKDIKDEEDAYLTEFDGQKFTEEEMVSDDTLFEMTNNRGEKVSKDE